jgi:hypothetical protein
MTTLSTWDFCYFTSNNPCTWGYTVTVELCSQCIIIRVALSMALPHPSAPSENEFPSFCPHTRIQNAASKFAPPHLSSCPSPTGPHPQTGPGSRPCPSLPQGYVDSFTLLFQTGAFIRSTPGAVSFSVACSRHSQLAGHWVPVLMHRCNAAVFFTLHHSLPSPAPHSPSDKFTNAVMFSSSATWDHEITRESMCTFLLQVQLPPVRENMRPSITLSLASLSIHYLGAWSYPTFLSLGFIKENSLSFVKENSLTPDHRNKCLTSNSLTLTSHSAHSSQHRLWVK